MAISVHVAYIQLMRVDLSGNIIGSKGNINDPNVKIKDMLNFDMQYRLIDDSTNVPNTASNPTIPTYLSLEASNDYQLSHIDQYVIITTRTTSASTPASVTDIGTASIATNQVTLSNIVSQFVAARTGRKSILIRNLDSSINIYIGIATVTTSTGILLKPLETVVINTTAALSAIAVSGTPIIAYLEEYT